MRRSDWHVRSGAAVLAWLAAAVVVSVLALLGPVADWFPVHLLLLGALSNAILIWSNHFAAAVLRLPDRRSGRPEAFRLGAFNLAAVLVVLGMALGSWWTVLIGGLGVAVVVCWHAVALIARMSRALPAPFGSTVRYYVAAGLLMPLGVALGVLMAPDDLDDDLHARLALAHVAVNLLGWVGLTLVGTLVTFWPTMLRTQISPAAERSARRALPVLVAGVLVTAIGALSGVSAMAVVGIAAYTAGLAMNSGPIADTVRRRPPTAYSTWSVLSAMIWLVGSVVALGLIIAVEPTWEGAAERADRLALPLLVGFAAQLLIGALSYLIPVALGGGPAMARATGAVLEWMRTPRLILVNLGVVLALVPLSPALHVATVVLVLLGLAAFLPLAVRAVLVARRQTPAPGDVTSAR